MLFIELIRAPSALVLLFWGAAAAGDAASEPLAAFLVLALNGAVYGAEIVRGGIEACIVGKSMRATHLGCAKCRVSPRWPCHRRSRRSCPLSTVWRGARS